MDSAFVQGIEKESSTIQIPDVITLFEQPIGAAQTIPVANIILSVATETEVDTLTNGTLIYLQERSIIPITPFPCQAISDCIITNDGDTKKVLV